MNYYQILQVSDNASFEIIEAVWKALMRKHHPDAGGRSNAKAQQINEAHDVLKDPAKRKTYDAQLREARLKKKPVSKEGQARPLHRPRPADVNAAGYPAAYPDLNQYLAEQSELIAQMGSQIFALGFNALFQELHPSIKAMITSAILGAGGRPK